MLSRATRTGRIAWISSVLVVACGLLAAGAGLSAARPARRSAVVSGYVEWCGGPAPGRCRKGKLGFCQAPDGCVTTSRVAAVNARGRRVAVQKLRHARFRFELEPGHYTIQLLGDGKHVRGRVMQTKKVCARTGHTAHVRFLFNVP